MRKQRLLLAAALVFSISGWVNAGVPVIKLAESQEAEGNSYSLLALNSYFVGIKDSGKPAGTSADNGMHGMQAAPVSPTALDVLSGIFKQVGNVSTWSNHQVSEGSFSSYAEGSSAYIAPFADSPRSADLRYGTMVATPQTPKSWAILLLVLGCVIYQGRQGRVRQRPFGIRKLD